MVVEVEGGGEWRLALRGAELQRLWRRLKFARMIFARRLGVGTKKDTLEMQCIRRDEEHIGALL